MQWAVWTDNSPRPGTIPQAADSSAHGPAHHGTGSRTAAAGCANW